MINRTGFLSGIGPIPPASPNPVSPAREVDAGEAALDAKVGTGKQEPFETEKRALAREAKGKSKEEGQLGVARSKSDSRNDAPVSSKPDKFEKSLSKALKPQKTEKSTAPDSQKVETQPVPLETDASDTVKTPVKQGVQDATVVDTRMVESTPIVFAGEVSEDQEVSPEEITAEVGAVLKFMMAMEKEFGIKPDALMSAMKEAQIENFDSQAPLSKAFFSKLGLEGQELRRAEYMYQNMFKEMAQNKMANYLEKTNQSLDVQLIDPTLVRKKELNQGIDQMQKSFFMNDTRPAYGKEDKLLKNLQQATQANSGQKPTPSQGESSAAPVVIPQEMQMVQPEMYTGQLQTTPDTLGSPENLDLPQDIEPQNQDRNSGSGRSALGLGTFAAGALAGAGAGAQQFGNSTGGEGNGKQEGKFSSAQQELSKIDAKSGESLADRFSVDTANSAAPTPIGKTDSAVQGLALAAPQATNGNPETRPEDAMNIRNIIQSAQVLIRKGGGEMKVQMHPEGLGQVDLKVLVKDGKVDLQVVAETSDTKRLLEKGIGDLKVSLAHQRLDLNDVKVDVARNTDRDMNNSQSDLNREQARQFLGQFREDREAFRQGFMELPQMRTYKKANPAQVEPVKPDDKPAAKGSSRLNVIA